MYFRLNGRLFFILGVFLLILGGCGSERGAVSHYTITISPEKSTLFGNMPVTIKISNVGLSSSLSISTCGRKFYNIEVSGSTIKAMLPGCPKPGWYSLEIESNGIKYYKNDAIYYYAPTTKFTSFVAVGASYTGGFLNLGLNWRDQLHSPFAYVAKQAGAYFPQPLVKEGIFRVIYPEALTEGCFPSHLAETYTFNLLKVVEKIKTGDGFYLSMGRIDPELIPYNLGVGAARITDTLYGAAKSNNPLVGVLEHLVYYPRVDIWEALSDPPSGSAFDVALALHPRYMLTVDLFADDLLYWHFAELFNLPMSPGVTPVEELERDLRYFFRETSKRGIKVFIADLPDITTLPAIAVLPAYLRKIGFSEDRIQALWNGLKADMNDYNRVFYSLASEYENVYPVPFSDEVRRFANGVTIAGNYYDLKFVGGLISLDGVHPTWTGYAMIGNLFIREINKVLGTSIPEVNIEKIAHEDPLKPSVLYEYVDPVVCRQQFYSGR